jgi:hypothetical protein
MMGSLNCLHMKREVETPSNKLDNPCFGTCFMFEKLSKYIKGNHKRFRKVHKRMRWDIKNSILGNFFKRSGDTYEEKLIFRKFFK